MVQITGPLTTLGKPKTRMYELDRRFYLRRPSNCQNRPPETFWLSVMMRHLQWSGFGF